MPIGHTRARLGGLGAIHAGLGAAQRGADGSFREPPWFTDCQPWQCGAPDSYITAQARADCPFWGPRGVLGCSSVMCSPSPWCAPAAPVTAGGGTVSTPVNASAPQPAVTAPASTTPQPKAVAVTVESANGPMVVSSDYVPGVADQSLTPVQIRIPNIWDLLDPSAVSQFEYRGLSTSLPVWISRQWRYQQAGGGASAPATAAANPVWVFVAIGAAAYFLGGATKRRATRGRK